ncbi:hypothetical protein SESBI_11983 [Sesbania bispinosa]|nr:hypothetical protein SESBI_11983 [Sesbania bispinosa]
MSRQTGTVRRHNPPSTHHAHGEAATTFIDLEAARVFGDPVECFSLEIEGFELLLEGFNWNLVVREAEDDVLDLVVHDPSSIARQRRFQVRHGRCDCDGAIAPPPEHPWSSSSTSSEPARAYHLCATASHCVSLHAPARYNAPPSSSLSVAEYCALTVTQPPHQEKYKVENDEKNRKVGNGEEEGQ